MKLRWSLDVCGNSDFPDNVINNCVLALAIINKGMQKMKFVTIAVLLLSLFGCASFNPNNNIEIHAIKIHEGNLNESLSSEPRCFGSGGYVDVYVMEAKNPVILLLSTHNMVTWRFHLDERVYVKSIYDTNNYSKIEGLMLKDGNPKKTTILRQNLELRKESQIKEYVKKEFDKELASYQTAHCAVEFYIQ